MLLTTKTTHIKGTLPNVINTNLNFLPLEHVLVRGVPASFLSALRVLLGIFDMSATQLPRPHGTIVVRDFHFFLTQKRSPGKVRNKNQLIQTVVNILPKARNLPHITPKSYNSCTKKKIRIAVLFSKDI